MGRNYAKYTYIHTPFNVGFCGGSAVKNPLPMQEIQEAWVRSLGQEDPLEKEMATHSSILAWGISPTEEPGGLRSTGSQGIGPTSVYLHSYIHTGPHIHIYLNFEEHFNLGKLVVKVRK